MKSYYNDSPQLLPFFHVFVCWFFPPTRRGKPCRVANRSSSAVIHKALSSLMCSTMHDWHLVSFFMQRMVWWTPWELLRLRAY